MSDRGRLSIWKDDQALDNWYDAAVHRNAGLRNSGKGGMEEMLFFDIATSNQVKYQSRAANDWFYGVGTGANAVVSSRVPLVPICRMV